jgi:DNA-binding MarR family transcriptional regulator
MGAETPRRHSDTLRVWRSLWVTSQRVGGRIAREFEETSGLPLDWYIVLAGLYESSDAVYQHRFSETTNLSQSGTSRMLAKMASAGLVEREVAAHDRRNVVLRLTSKGRDVVLRATPEHNRAVEQHFGRHLGDDVAPLTSLLDRLSSGDEPLGDPAPMEHVVKFGKSLLSVTADEVLVADALRTREALELPLLLDAAQHLPESAAAELHSTVAEMAQRLDDPETFFKVDWELHRQLAGYCQNTTLRAIYLQLLSIVASSNASVIPTDGLPEYLGHRLSVHARLVEAVLGGDAEQIAAATGNHQFAASEPLRIR